MRTVTLCHTSNKFTVITEAHITHSSSFVSQSRAILTLSPGSPPSLSLSLLSDNDNDNDNDHNDDCDDFIHLGLKTPTRDVIFCVLN